MPDHSTKLTDAEPELAKRLSTLLADFHTAYPGWKALVTCTHRPPEAQFILFKKGREWDGQRWNLVDTGKRVTNMDGYKLVSLHNYWPSRAIDIAVVAPNGTAFWDTESNGIAEHETGLNPWTWLHERADKYGLDNSISWDRPHFQIKKA